MNYLHSCIMLNKILSSWYNFPGYTLASLANNSLPDELQHL